MKINIIVDEMVIAVKPGRGRPLITDPPLTSSTNISKKKIVFNIYIYIFFNKAIFTESAHWADLVPMRFFQSVEVKRLQIWNGTIH